MSGRPGRFPASTSVVTSAPTSARPLRAGASRLGTALRLPTFVAVGASLGTAAHTATAHALPDLRLLLPVVGAVALCGLVIRGRERSFETITAALLASQVVVHVVLALAPGPDGAAAGGHVHGASGTATVALAHLVPDGPMLLAHLLAAGVAGWWLRRGEAAVWAAVNWVWPALTGLAAVPRTPATAPALWRGRGVEALSDLLTVSGAHPRRGPPAHAAV